MPVEFKLVYSFPFSPNLKYLFPIYVLSEDQIVLVISTSIFGNWAVNDVDRTNKLEISNIIERFFIVFT